MGFPNYRRFWIGGVLTNNGRWVQYVTTYFIVYRITGSAAWVGMAGFSTFIPVLLMNPLAATCRTTSTVAGCCWRSTASAACWQ